MDIVYYPDQFITSDTLLKGLLLTWGRVRTIIPPSEKDYVDEYLAGRVKKWVHLPLEKYKEVYDTADEPVVDFLVIDDAERVAASNQMFDLLVNWNKDTHFYDSLKIRSLDDLAGKTMEWYWFLHEKVEASLVDLMVEENLVWPLALGELAANAEVGKSYMGIIADEVSRRRGVRLVTDDEFLLAAKAGLRQRRVGTRAAEDHYQLISLAIPQLFLSESLLRRLTWKKIMSIRRVLLPLAESYYKEVEDYQTAINRLTDQGKDADAFVMFCEFCERVAVSFKPFSKEAGKILRCVSNQTHTGLLNGIILPTVKLLCGSRDLAKACDVIAISTTAAQYSLTTGHLRVGFEYLQTLNRALNIERLRTMVTCLVPRSIKRETEDRSCQ